MVLKKTRESPFNNKENKPVNPKGKSTLHIQLEGLMLKRQYFGHLMQRADSLEKILMLGKTEGKEEEAEDETVRWPSPTQWT